MNFHKTIGYLAALLLMLGIGVPDSFAQDPAIAETLGIQLTRDVMRDSITVDHQVRVNVTVGLDKAATAATTVTVALTDDSGDGEYSAQYSSDAGAQNTSTDVVVEFATGERQKTVTHYGAINPADASGEAGDNDGDDETGTITGTIADPDGDVNTDDDITATDTFTIQDYSVTFANQDAADARGYQVHISNIKKAASGWVKTGKNINVQVRRRNHIGADFGRFSQIQVALRDSANLADDTTGNDNDNLTNLTITVADVRELGTLNLERVRSHTLSATETGATANVDKVVYIKRSSSGDYDTLEFRFNIKAGDINDVEKVYAVAVFTSTPGTVTLSNQETKRFLVPSNTSVFPNEKVGDGNLFSLDNDPPDAAILQEGNLTVSFGNTNKAKTAVVAPIDDLDVSTYSQRVKRNQLIVIEADFDAFEEYGVKFQVFSMPAANLLADVTNRPADPALAGNVALAPYAKSFDASTVYSTDVLRDSVQVQWAKLKRKYPDVNPTGDQNFPKKGVVPDGHVGYDNFPVNVRISVLDKAGNATVQTTQSPGFLIDFKLPKVEILYPKPSATDSARFTAGILQEYEFLGDDLDEQKLKPLKFRVDEEAFLAWVIIGTDTLVATDEASAAFEADQDANLDGDGGPYELTLDLTTLDLKNPEPDEDQDPTNDHPATDAAVGGSEVALKVVVQDRAKNKGTGTPDGQAIFDAKAPGVINLFPNTDALADYDNKIGGPEQTQNPVFSINEEVDSILVRFEGSSRRSVAGTVDQLSMVDKNIRISFTGEDALADGESYDLQVYVRDLAKNVGLSDSDPDNEGAEPERGLTFENNLDNPDAGGFEIVSEVRDNTKGKKATEYAKMDSVVAGQALRLTITAIDVMLTEQSGETRPAITYDKDGAIVEVTHSDPTASVSYWGGGVTENDDGTATLDGAGWAIGVRKIFVASETAGTLSFAVKDMTAEGVPNFMGTKEGVVVDAADFTKIVLSAWEDGQETINVWEDFGLRMVPTDQFGNASLKTFFGQTPETAGDDSLNILDTRLENEDNTAKEYGDGVDIQLQATPPLEGLLSEVWGVGQDGHTLTVTAPNRPGVSVTIQARVRSSSVDDDTRSENNRGSLNLTISEPSEPLDISITLWVPGVEGDQAGNEVTVPAGESVTVTARAEGLTEGDMVTFTVDGEAQEAVAADADGYAGQPIELSGDKTVSVTATSGQASASLDITSVEAPVTPTRKAYTNAEGEPVYLISDTDMTVGIDDFLAFVAAYESSEGDENYNLQADVHPVDEPDGDVDLQDFLEFISSYGREAVGPSTKPLVLLPGINENAEFLLSLGSERVIAGELVAVDVSLANVEALMGYGFALNYETDKFEFVSVAPADEDLLKSTGGETLFHHIVADGQVTVANGVYNGTAISGGGDVVRFVFRVLYEFEDNARFEIADGLVFDPSQLQNPALVAGVLELQSTPREFALHQNFPNPFNPDTTIKYDLAESADITLQIYNVLGQVVRTLVVSEAQNAGRYQIRWNGMDDRGVPVSSGVYFYRISADGKFQNVRKLMLLK